MEELLTNDFARFANVVSVSLILIGVGVFLSGVGAVIRAFRTRL